MLIRHHFPNKVPTVHFTTAAATWVIIASDGTGHATKAAMIAAGKVAWPSLPPGGQIGYALIKCENGSGADGAPVYFVQDKDDTWTPADNDAQLLSGSGQGIELPCPFNNVWVRKTTAGDELILSGAW